MIEALDTTDKIIGGTTLIGIAFYSARKMLTFWKTEGTTQASAQAIEAQFKALQDAIDSYRKEMIAIRIQQERMSFQIHKQQTKLTRMEMLLRQFSGLVREHGIEAPKFMQDELDDLIKQDFERVETPDARMF